jgi:hypothetical protein
MNLERADGLSVRVALSREITLLPLPSISGLRLLTLRVRSTLLNQGASTLRRKAGLWNILQVPTEVEGTFLVPLRDETDGKAHRLYFGELPPDWPRRDRRLLVLRARAGQRWKIGLPADRARGPAVFLRPSRTDRSWTLVLQRCRVQRFADYLDRPPGMADGPGDVLQFYNHGDSAVPFSELECHAPARTIAPGGLQTATVDYLLAKGRRDELLQVLGAFLGVPLRPALLFP